MIYRKTVLENGLRVITEAWPHTEAASVGIWVRTGSRDERPEENGLSHFIEHLVFKGTRRRSALDIVREIESVGGTINAFTAKEYTCFHAKVLDKDLPLALDVLCDLLTEPLFDPVELEKERMVILQEIKMADDVPDDHIYDLFHRSFWGDHPLGLPIIGTKETVSSFSREQIEGFFRRRYTPERMIVAAAGHIEHEEVVREVEKRLGSIPPSDDHRPEPRAEGGKGGVGVEYRELEQVHLCLGVRGIPYAHPNRFAGYVLHTILGGNMSSRLFQEIREKRGLT
ncbi:MAG: insulinase family protein, partial [Deltaproteobacteria bacterium]